MTIAAGFKLSNGLLLCTDSLFTDGFTEYYGDKVFKYRLGNDIDALFGIAGSVSHAKTFIQHLDNVMANKPYSLALARETISMETADFNITHKDSIGETGLQLICGMRHRSEGHCMMVCDGTASHQSNEPHEFIGCGRSIAKPLADLLNQYASNDKDRIRLAFSVLSIVKSIDPNCKGKTQFGHLGNDRSQDEIDTKSGVIEFEGYTHNFFGSAIHAFFGCSKDYSAEDMEGSLEIFNRTVKGLHTFPLVQPPKAL